MKVVFPRASFRVLVNETARHINREETPVGLFMHKCAVVVSLLDREPKPDVGVEGDIYKTGRSAKVLKSCELGEY